MANNKTTAEEMETLRQKRLSTLMASYEMYEASKIDAKKKHEEIKDKDGNRIYSDAASKETIKLMETMQQDIFDEYVQLGGDPEDLKKISLKKKKGIDRSTLENIVKQKASMVEMAEYIKNMNNQTPQEVTNNTSEETETVEKTVKEEQDNSLLDNYAEESITLHDKAKSSQNNSESDVKTSARTKQMYDLVKLPSRGIPYKNGKEKLKVAYLTAFDENMILAPGLYEDGSFLTKLLEAKILDDFDANNLLPGDRDAIVIWLRATGYGNEYPITVTDPATGREFNTTFDLSTIKYKPFDLKSDGNGYFDFTLPVSGDIVKFKFLTIADHKFLNEIKAKETLSVSVSELRESVDKITSIVKNNENIKQEVSEKITKLANDVYEEIIKDYDIDKDKTFSHILTNTLILQTVSVNGIKDRNYISDYIMNMNVKDAAEYRKYVSKNEPGIDYNVKVERPKSLGGGSIDTFLQLSQFIFVNIE